MNVFILRAALIGFLAVAPGCVGARTTPVPDAVPGALTFRTADGFTIAADLQVPPGATGEAPAPLVLLGHELETDRRTWDPLLPRLLEAGYAVCAVDHRGFGGSRKEAAGPGELTESARAALDQDLLGALDAAAADARVDASRVVAVGSGISVPAAIGVARERPVSGLILFVGLLDRDAEDFLLDHPDLPLLLVAAAGDGRGVELMRQYAGRLTGPVQAYVEVVPPEGEPTDWRGSAGLASDSGLPELMLWFLQRHLPAE